MKLDNNQQAFFALVRAGLWETEVKLSQFKQIDFNHVYRLAKEQSVVGLVAAGIEHVVDVKIPHQVALTFVGSVLQLEQRNLAMNDYVASLIEYLGKENIFSVLIKGQGVAQCYERPLWRSSGDIDLLLSNEDYEKAKLLLIPQAEIVEQEYSAFKHLGILLGGFEVELHGSFHSRLSKKVENQIDSIQDNIFLYGNTRVWHYGNTDIYLPSANEDVILVFTHILRHFFFEGIGLRQICDLCRLLWTFSNTIDSSVLSFRLSSMGLMSEWKSFASFAVDWLGMPVEAMPLYSSSPKWKHKAEHIGAFVLEVGNFGQKKRRDYSGLSYLIRKFKSFFGRISDIFRHFVVFPKDTIVFLGGVLRSGLDSASRGE